ncbi:tyrosine-type recombinase/integrase [Rhizobium sp. ARZ01]|uniref:tyrosine-type recombinase/integrase n=1 Tax=Rhizobium sp. ARZ01 TaxID=2769313 RepID=UPI0017820FA6|nr:tyrosine-type recombinase/integrase [Rhizobium sp. ARZ01]MBD9373202.1 tyrosine-type recombinase/integrase [Rhizobium sp. ARZ01]
MGLVLQYVQEPKGVRGIYRYRRRVPAELKPFIGKSELVASLGQSKPEALKRYPATHAAFERELEIASKALAREKRKQSPNDRTRLVRYGELMDEIRALGIDSPETAAQDEDEAFQREIIAESIAARYPEDPETGYPLITNPDDVLKVQALMGAAPAKPAPTLEDAKRVYVAEKLDGTDFEFRKKLRRVERIIEAVNAALDPVPTLDRWTRETAKKVRDHYIAAGLKPASVKRELNTLKGMITCYITEKEASFTNPFSKLELPKSVEAASESRYPIPDVIKDKITAIILSKAKKDVQLLWRLVDGTGTRIAEITGLRVQDIVVEGELPHLKIVAHPERRLKTESSTRDVPLVGDALAAAREALTMAGNGPYVFARYIKPTGPTTASAVLMKRIREVTTEPKHTVHSLRHGMADRLSLAEASAIDKNAIMGHLNPGTGEHHYGGRHAKLKVLTRVMNKAFGLGAE